MLTNHKNVKSSKYLHSRNLKYSLLGNPTPPPPHTHTHTTVMDNMTKAKGQLRQSIQAHTR